MKVKTLSDLYLEQLQDLHNAETQLLAALPKMAQAAGHPELKQAFAEHLLETREHVARLDGILGSLNKGGTTKKCPAMQGLIKEGEELMDESARENARDAGLICAAQKVEHYEIASYGTLRTFAELLGHAEHARTLERTLEEEKKTDGRLSELATSVINLDALA
ncbi:MAG: ferritin-like domain-containing protein [Planctomycetota bacterium]|nr:ferritin-like domain-containing protein [Planctomycetota bacterium]